MPSFESNYTQYDLDVLGSILNKESRTMYRSEGESITSFLYRYLKAKGLGYQFTHNTVHADLDLDAGGALSWLEKNGVIRVLGRKHERWNKKGHPISVFVYETIAFPELKFHKGQSRHERSFPHRTIQHRRTVELLEPIEPKRRSTSTISIIESASPVPPSFAERLFELAVEAEQANLRPLSSYSTDELLAELRSRGDHIRAVGE